MPQILSSASFNASSLAAPDTYVVNTPPPALAQGAQTNIGGVVGSASWGPLNTPILLGSQNDATSAFGPLSAAALTDAHDLASDLTFAFNQAQARGTAIGIWGVRVSDGTDVAASVILKDSAAATGGTLTALYTGVMGNALKIVIAAGGAAATSSVSLSGFAGGYSELFPNLPNANFWAALASALANGISGVRGPSRLVRFAVETSSAAPALGTFTLAGGLDGRSAVTTANLTGEETALPYTGAYTLQTVSPGVTELWIAGLTDSTAFAAMQALCDGMGAQFNFAFPTGTTTEACITDLQGYGISDYNVNAIKDWLYVFDPVNNQVRLINPVAVAVGALLSLSPEQSPLNKPVYGVIGTERVSAPTGANQPYGDTEIGQLNQAGILFITNPCPGGAYFGFRDGVNTAMPASQVEGPVEFARMTNFEAASIASVGGQFAGQLQTQQPNDPLQAAVSAAFNSFFQQQKTAGIIDDWNVQCNQANNPPASVAAHKCVTYIWLRYLSSVWYFVAQLTGGTTVVTSGSTLSQALQGQA